MTSLFYGWGLGLVRQPQPRPSCGWSCSPIWALMLLWSKPWLDRFHYGPFEWLWRSLARWQAAADARSAPAAAAAEA